MKGGFMNILSVNSSNSPRANLWNNKVISVVNFDKNIPKNPNFNGLKEDLIEKLQDFNIADLDLTNKAIRFFTKKILKNVINSKNIESANDFLNNGHITDGTNSTISLIFENGEKLFTGSNEKYNMLIDKNANVLMSLSDSSVYKGLKQDFLTAVFLRNSTACYPSSFIPRFKNNLSDSVVALFKNLDNNIHGDFKQKLLDETVNNCIILPNIEKVDSMLENLGSATFRLKIKSLAQKNLNDFNNALDVGASVIENRSYL